MAKFCQGYDSSGISATLPDGDIQPLHLCHRHRGDQGRLWRRHWSCDASLDGTMRARLITSFSIFFQRILSIHLIPLWPSQQKHRASKLVFRIFLQIYRICVFQLLEYIKNYLHTFLNLCILYQILEFFLPFCILQQDFTYV